MQVQELGAVEGLAGVWGESCMGPLSFGVSSVTPRGLAGVWAALGQVRGGTFETQSWILAGKVIRAKEVRLQSPQLDTCWAVRNKVLYKHQLESVAQWRR